MKNGYAICFNEWALDKDIKNELGLLVIISSLTAEKGYCFASNNYFSKLFDIPEENISRKIKKLEQKGYITIEYEKRGCEIINRLLRLTKISIDDCQNYQSTIDKNVKDNNISINIKEIDNNKLLSTKKKFIPPTLEDVKKYCEEKNFDIDYQAFYDYYNVSNWKDSEGKQVKNWKQKMITWATRRKNNNSTSKQIIPDWFGKEIKDEDGEWEFSEEDKRRFGLL